MAIAQFTKCDSSIDNETSQKSNRYISPMRIRILYILILLLPLSGCPHMMIRQFEEMQPPPNYKPRYQMSEKSMDSILNAIPFSLDRAMKSDSILAVYERGMSVQDSILPMPQAGIDASLIGINDAGYPDSIHVKLSIKDEKGFFVKGLAGPNRKKVIKGKDSIFRLLIDSCGMNVNNQQITQFTVHEINEDARKPLALSMVLDHSPSMGEMRAKKLQEAVRLSMDMLTDDDAIAVVKFTKKIHREVPLSSNYEQYTSQFKIDGLRGIKPISFSISLSGDSTIPDQSYGGGTAIYDGAIAGIDEFTSTHISNKVMIVFSDGGDNSSTADEDSVIRHARKNGVIIHTIAYGQTDEDILRKLSENTGGKMYRIYTTKEFPFVLADIIKSMKNHYVISYAPPISADKHRVSGVIALRKDIMGTIHGFYDKSMLHSWDAIGTVYMEEIEFEKGSSILPPMAEPILNDIYSALKSSPNVKLEIRGHTDDIGKEEDNEQLSLSRAQSVAGALIARGISKSRLIISGKGESMPLMPNDSESSRKKNRRTEFIIIQ